MYKIIDENGNELFINDGKRRRSAKYQPVELYDYSVGHAMLRMSGATVELVLEFTDCGLITIYELFANLGISGLVALYNEWTGLPTPPQFTRQQLERLVYSLFFETSKERLS